MADNKQLNSGLMNSAEAAALGMALFLRRTMETGLQQWTGSTVMGKGAIMTSAANMAGKLGRALAADAPEKAAIGAEETLTESAALAGGSKIPIVGLVVVGGLTLDKLAQGKTEAAKHAASSGLGNLAGSSIAGGFAATAPLGIELGPYGIAAAGAAGGVIGYFGGPKAVDAMESLSKPIVEYLEKADPALVKQYAQWDADFRAGLLSRDQDVAEQAKRDYVAHFASGSISLPGNINLLPDPVAGFAERSYQWARSRNFQPLSKDEMLAAMPGVASGYIAALGTKNPSIAREAYGEYVRFIYDVKATGGLDQAAAENLIISGTELFQKQSPAEFSRLAASASLGAQVPAYVMTHVAAPTPPAQQTPAQKPPVQITQSPHKQGPQAGP